MWARRPRLPHTHTQPRRTIVHKSVATPWTPAMHQGPTSRRCGHARRRSTPTPRAMHKQHTKPRPSCCVPFRRPTCPQCNAIGQHQAGMQPQQRNICDGPVRVKALRLGRQSGSSCVNGVSSWCTEPPVTKAHHRNDTNPPRNVKGSHPHPPNPPDHLG